MSAPRVQPEAVAASPAPPTDTQLAPSSLPPEERATSGSSASSSTRLAGTWRNQLGSWLVLEPGPAGSLQGSFGSVVGGTPAIHPVAGFYDPAPLDDSPVVGFVVRWPGGGSLATWTGYYDSADDTIRASWVLVSETTPETAWRRFSIGHDVFRRSTRGERQPEG